MLRCAKFMLSQTVVVAGTGRAGTRAPWESAGRTPACASAFARCGRASCCASGLVTQPRRNARPGSAPALEHQVVRPKARRRRVAEEASNAGLVLEVRTSVCMCVRAFCFSAARHAARQARPIARCAADVGTNADGFGFPSVLLAVQARVGKWNWLHRMGTR